MLLQSYDSEPYEVGILVYTFYNVPAYIELVQFELQIKKLKNTN